MKRLVCIFLSCLCANAWALDAITLEKQYVSQANQASSVARGDKFFQAKHGKDWSCASVTSLHPPQMVNTHQQTKPLHLWHLLLMPKGLLMKLKSINGSKEIVMMS
jgi:hypothetical protein